MKTGASVHLDRAALCALAAALAQRENTDPRRRFHPEENRSPASREGIGFDEYETLEEGCA